LENSLLKSLETIEQETQIHLNALTDDSCYSLILEGSWDLVLGQLVKLDLDSLLLVDLYEQIAVELVETLFVDVAKSLVRQAEPLLLLKDLHPARYLFLESLLSGDSLDEYYSIEPKQSRRKRIADTLCAQLQVVEPSRLVTLIGQALKWQQSQGYLDSEDSIDLFRGSSTLQLNQVDQVPTQVLKQITFPKKYGCVSCAFSPNGDFIVTGTKDGFVEVWNYMTGKLRKDLKYQAEENMMMMETSVLALAFSTDGKLLATGSEDVLLVTRERSRYGISNLASTSRVYRVRTRNQSRASSFHAIIHSC
jgi:WD40 repeat-containing protein SMU1